MALLFMDGFDHYGPEGDPSGLGKWGSYFALPATVQTLRPRTGLGSLRFLGPNYSAITKALPASGGAIVGFAVIGDTTWSTNFNLLEIREGSTVHLAVQIAPGGLASVKRGTTILATGTHPIPLAGWVYIEFRCVLHDSAGSYELRIDGVTELAASGIDTRDGGATGQWDRLFVGGAAQTSNMDDLYICDTTGAAPRNTFLGPVKIQTLLPQTDAVAAGSNAGLTPSTGTDHGALVDEAAPNTTDYNASATVGLKDTYQYPALTLTGQVLGIQTNLYVSKSDAAARQVCAVVRSGGVDYDGASVAPLTTFAYSSEVRAQNPNTSTDWTSAAVAALEAGMKVTG